MKEAHPAVLEIINAAVNHRNACYVREIEMTIVSARGERIKVHAKAPETGLLSDGTVSIASEKVSESEAFNA